MTQAQQKHVFARMSPGLRKLVKGLERTHLLSGECVLGKRCPTFKAHVAAHHGLFKGCTQRAACPVRGHGS